VLQYRDRSAHFSTFLILPPFVSPITITNSISYYKDKKKSLVGGLKKKKNYHGSTQRKMQVEE
jgi:hypothetical protein